MTGATTGADRGVPKVRVLFGTERFSSQHSWSELTALMPARYKPRLTCSGARLTRLPSVPATS